MYKMIRYSCFMVCLLCMGWLAGCDDDDDKLGAGRIAVTGFSPTEGLPGVEVTINGTGFGDDARVYFNESEVTDYISRSATALVVRVPEDASTGRIGVLSDKGDFGFSAGDFTFIPSAVIEKYSTDRAPAGETLVIYGRNFFDLPAEEIVVKFGTAEATLISASATEIAVLIPEGAESGPITVQFGTIQTISGPLFTVGRPIISVPDYLVNTKNYLLGNGTFKVDDNFIDGTKKGAYVIYEIVPEADGLYTMLMSASTNQGYNCYVNIDMGTDADALAAKPNDQALTRQVQNMGGWAAFGDYAYGPFLLTGGRTYYLKVSFTADGNSWVCNLKDLILHYADDQDAEGIDVDSSASADYNLYANDFNSENTLPFLLNMAGTNYIKVIDQCLEFYYDPQMMVDHPGERAYKGAEITCDGFSTRSEGWYGYRFYLPEGKFPKEASGTIITQIFNSGYGNTWAGHLHIDGETLAIGYRGSSAANAEIDKDICKLEWGKWTKLVIYFQAGNSNKGNIRIWVGDEVQEDKPTLALEGINLGFGSWADSNTLEDSHFGCKFGLYVADTYERTFRMDDIKALEGNPAGAFDLVKP